MPENQEQNQDESNQSSAKKTGKNALEWAVFGASSLGVTAVFGWLLLSALGQNSNPPRLEISLGEPVKAGKRVLVPVKVENRGDATAASVEVEVEVEVERKSGSGKSGSSKSGSGKSGETANFSFPHLPRQSTREGWVAFDGPLSKTELSAKILGYEEP